MASGTTARRNTDTGPRMLPFGRYLILRKLAAGGMAEIFLAKQTGISGFERLVVIKRILPQLSGNREFITMFLDEARTAAQLTHPNVVQIYDMGQIDESYYIAMEYIHGEDLRRVYNQEVQRGSRIPVHFAAHLVAQAAQGLDYAHRKVDISGTPLGLVHRDISPQNLLVSYDGHVKVVDFGVAKAAKNEALTKSGVLKGKYSYMSPEQAQGLKIDSRTDVFALAVVLYEVTCGERLFKRAVEMDTLHAVIACEVPPPSKLDPAYPPALEKIILKALSKNPARRHATAGELARDLEEFVRSGDTMVGPSELGAYLQELFADKLAEELLMGSQMWEEDHTDAGRKREQQRQFASGHARDSAVGTTYEGEELEEVSAVEVSQVAFGRPDAVLQTSPETLDQPLTDGMTGTAIDPPQTVAVRPPRGRSTMTEPLPKRSLWAAALGVIAVLGAGVWLAASGVFDAPKLSGSITITSRPTGAAIFLDGLRLAGLETPVTLEHPIAPGDHHVKLEREGFDSAEGTLSAVSGEKTTFDLDLHAHPAPIALPPTALTPASPGRLEPKIEIKRVGTLTVHSSIPLRVFNGKNFLGTTPLQRVLPSGPYMLHVEHERSGWSETQRIIIANNETVKLDLNVPMGTLRINVQPFANVRVANITGETPLAPIDLPAGHYVVHLSNQQLGKDETAKVQVTAGHETGLERNWR